MNDLNSVLIEGNIVGLEIEEGEVFFTLISKRNDFSFSIKVLTTGELAKAVIRNFSENRRVRVVGRLSFMYESNIIVAEHIEWKAIEKQQLVQEELDV